MATTSKPGPAHLDRSWSVSSKRLEELAWGVFLLMTGVLWLLPSELVPPGSWLIGTGVILLGMNVLRYVNGHRVSLFTAVLGALALGGGVAERIGLKLPLLAMAIVIAGTVLILNPLVRRGRN